MLSRILKYALFMAVFNFLYSIGLQSIESAYFVLALLLIFVVPILLYFAYRYFFTHHWNYRLPIVKVITSGISIVLLGACFLSTFHWLNGRFVHIYDYHTEIDYFSLLWNYLYWYMIFAAIGIPIAYVAIRLRVKSILRRKD